MQENIGPMRSRIKVVKQRVRDGIAQPSEEDWLAIEDPLAITVSDEDAPEGESADTFITMRTPGHDREMITGYLFAEGVIPGPDAITAIEFNEPAGPKPPVSARVFLKKSTKGQRSAARRTIQQSSCGVCGKSSLASLALSPDLRFDDNLKIPASWIHELPERLRTVQPTFASTGGLHAAALFAADGSLLAACEDIGRHNALDKAIGSALLSGQIPGHAVVVAVSGRMSYEIIQKALMARIPVIAGIGAPSSLAVSLANDFNITLLGFVRPQSYNIYSSPDRLTS